MKVVLESASGGAWSVKRYDEAGKLVSEVPRAVAVRDLCHILHKSRRQVYRYIRDGRLATAGKYLGEWLVNARGLDWFAGEEPSTGEPLPSTARPLFPEYDMKKLNPVHDSAVIVPRLMENGGWNEIRWLLRTYSGRWLGLWLAHEGWRLGDRSAVFWGRMLGGKVSRVRPIPGKAER